MLRQFYPDISNGDILAYALDPQNALTAIKRKITAAEIGAAATQQGLQTGVSRAEELGRFGVTKQQAQQGFQTIGEFLPSAVKLGDIYANPAVDQTGSLFSDTKTRTHLLLGQRPATKMPQPNPGRSSAIE